MTAYSAAAGGGWRALKLLICLMFFLFAMTTDAVGSIIPLVIREFHLTMTAAGAFHYAPMAAIACGALLLGFLADSLGRKPTILLGLGLYALGSGLFALSHSFGIFVALLTVSGFGISIFKIGALALVGEVARSTREHTSLMNALEGCFGVGSIVGPATVAFLIVQGTSWKWLYVGAAAVCLGLIVSVLLAKFPRAMRGSIDAADLNQSFRLLRNPFALGFSLLIALYVSVEVAIYVWMPTYLQSYHGSNAWLATYGLTIFFVLRAAGRFLSALVLRWTPWAVMVTVCGGAIFVCFSMSLVAGVKAGAVLLPLSGLFMATLYPTLNSKGISCFRKSQHGAVAGVILFFTAAAATLSPLAMAAVSDHYGSMAYGFGLATIFSLLLFIGLLINWRLDPTTSRLRELDATDYGPLSGNPNMMS